MIRVFTAFALAIAMLAAGAAGASAQSSATLKTPAALKAKAPDTYKVKFDTSMGVFVVQVHRDWAPLGADRFYNLVKAGLLRRRPLLPRHPGLHGAVRHPRRSDGVGASGATRRSATTR